MRRAHGHAPALLRPRVALPVTLAVALVGILPATARAGDLACAQGAPLEFVMKAPMVDWLEGTPHVGTVRASLRFRMLCGPPALLSRAGALLGALSKDLVSSPGSDRPRVASGPMEIDRAVDVVVSPVSFAAGRAAYGPYAATFTVGAGSAYDGNHFSPIVALRLRPELR